MNIYYKIKKNKKGISIIEVVAVIFIVSVAFVAIVTLVQQNIRVQNINKNSITASQLAQEGLETARNIRERNWQISGNAFYEGLHSGTDGVEENFVSPLIIVSADPRLIPTDNIDDSETELFVCADGDYASFIAYKGVNGCAGNTNPTIYRRMIKTKYDATAKKVIVTCEVKWSERGNTRIYSASEELYDWY